ncbi:MAG: S8 family peptidase [Fimbriimonas sp.]
MASAIAFATPADSAVPGEVLVRYRDGAPGGSVSRTLSAAALRAQPMETNAPLGVTRLRLAPGADVAATLAQLRKDPNVLYAEPNYIATKHVTPDDTYYNSTIQWPLFKMEAAAAWNYATGTGIKVAVLDTGVQANHPDLTGKVVAQYDFAYNDAVADDVDGHGTHTAGTIGAVTYNATGVASLGYNVQLMCGKVLNDSGSGSHAAIANGITWAADNGAKVINMSLGGTTGSTTLQNAVTYAVNKGVLVVASAGNAGNTRANYPAYYSNTLAVAATDRNDARASFSTYGSWVDIAAPGVDVASTYPGSQYVYMSGTSMAAPHVSALAALVAGTSYGTSASAIRTRLINTGDPVSTKFGQYPLRRINARKAVLPATP